MTEPLVVTTRAVRYEVCALPETWPLFEEYYDCFVITVALTQDGTWSVKHRGRYLDHGGHWDCNNRPGGYTLEQALHFAKVHAPRVQSGRMTAAEFMQWADAKLEDDHG